MKAVVIHQSSTNQVYPAYSTAVYLYELVKCLKYLRNIEPRNPLHVSAALACADTESIRTSPAVTPLCRAQKNNNAQTMQSCDTLIRLIIIYAIEL